MICHQPDVNKIDLHAKDPFEAKYQLFINKRKNVISKPYNICEAFIEYSNGYFTIQSFLSVAKNIRLNSTQMKKRKKKKTMKIPNKWGLQELAWDIYNIIHKILISRILWTFVNNVLQNYIGFS